MANPIDFSDIFNFSDTQDFQRALDFVKDGNKVFERFEQNLKNTGQQYRQTATALVKRANEVEQALKGLDSASEENRQQIMKLAREQGNITNTYNSARTATNQLNEAERKLSKERQEFAKSSEEVARQERELEKLQRRLSSLDGDRAQEIARVRAQIQERNKALRQSAKESLGLVSVYQQESRRLIELRNNYKDVALTLGENSKEAKALQEEVAELDERLKSVDAGAGQFQRNVGNYAGALDDVGGAAGVAIGGLRAFGQAAARLLLNPIVALVALLAGTLITLFNAWRRSAEGANLFLRASAFVDGILSELVDIAVSVSQAIQGIFQDPLGALQDFGNFLVQNVINRFRGLIMLLENVAFALGQLLAGNFDVAKRAAQAAGQAFIQFQTGLDAEQQQRIVNGLASIAEEATNTANSFVQLAVRTRELNRINQDLETSIARINKVETEANAILSDSTRSFRELEQAAERARQAAEQRSAAEIQIAQNQLSLINEELRLRRANGEAVEDLLDRQAEATRAVIQAETEQVQVLLDNERERRQIIQDRLERDLDILIDGFDNQRTINERIIADDRRTLQSRQELFAETERLARESFDQQIATVQQFTDARINADELLNESDAIALNQRIRSLGLSEIIEGRLLEIVRERRIAIQDLNDAQRDLADEEQNIALRRRAVQQADLDRAIERARVEEQNALTGIDALNRRIDLEIQAEMFRRDTLLQNEQLLAEEREQIIADSEQRIQEIREEGFQNQLSNIEQASQAVFQFANQISSFVSALNAQRQEEDEVRLERLQTQREQELAAAGDNAIAQAQINERFDRQQERIERRAAQRRARLARIDKALQVSQSIINTAVAVTRVLPNIPLAIAIGAFGAIRTATIAAQPIPQFAEGTDASPAGPIIVGEKGRELVVTPDGKLMMTPSKATLTTDIPEGSQIFTNAVTEGMLRNPDKLVDENIRSSANVNDVLAAERHGMLFNRLSKSFTDNSAKLAQIIQQSFKDLPEIHQWHFNNGQMQKNIRKGNTTYLNVKQRNTYGSK